MIGEHQHKQHEVLIVSKPNRFSEGLRAVVKAMPEVKAVYYTEDGHSVQERWGEAALEIALLDIDLTLPKLRMILRQLRLSYPNMKSIVLVENEHQKVSVLAAGADATLMKGFDSEHLAQVIHHLMTQKTTTV
ncbi:MAG: hypothetical protein Kow0080_05720 [Candidatus Promineifilaceae bacterium]